MADPRLHALGELLGDILAVFGRCRVIAPVFGLGVLDLTRPRIFVLSTGLAMRPTVAVLTTASIFAIQLMMMCFFNMVGLLIGPMMIFNVSCAFGIASDSMVHVLHLWTTLREKAAPLPAGYNSYIQLVMAQLGTPILFASLSTMGMFACFGPLAGALAHIMMCHQLVLLFVIFVAVCLYHSVVFTPAVLLLFEKRFPLETVSTVSATVSAA